MLTRPLLCRLAIVAALLGSAGTAAAQSLTVVLREEGTNQPVLGALVQVLNGATREAQALTGPGGRATFTLTRAGSYTVRISRIGYGPLTVPAVQVELGAATTLPLELPMVRLTLPELTVEATTRCRSSSEAGVLLGMLWNDIQTALLSLPASADDASAPVLVREFRREVSRAGVIQAEWGVLQEIRRGPVYQALPAATLARTGFMETMDGDSLRFAAPDAGSLLSAEFVTTHCYRAALDSLGRIGLQFDPSHRRDIVDISGTMWLDRATRELQELTFVYTGLPRILEGEGLGGQVVYQRRQDGSWGISSWVVRTPRLQDIRAEDHLTMRQHMAARGNSQAARARLEGFLDLGGTVSDSAPGHAPSTVAVARGSVRDSAAGSGIGGVQLSLGAAAGSGVTDTSGTFWLTTDRAGPHELRLVHPRFAGANATRPVVLSIGDTSVVDIIAPDLRGLGERACGRRPGQGGLLGTVLDPNGIPQAVGRIRVTWTDGNGRPRSATKSVDRNGLFAVCDAPLDTPLTVSVEGSRLPGAGVSVAVELSWGEYRWLELDGRP